VIDLAVGAATGLTEWRTASAAERNEVRSFLRRAGIRLPGSRKDKEPGIAPARSAPLKTLGAHVTVSGESGDSGRQDHSGTQANDTHIRAGMMSVRKFRMLSPKAPAV
jgi:hypothetical protein